MHQLGKRKLDANTQTTLHCMCSVYSPVLCVIILHDCVHLNHCKWRKFAEQNDSFSFHLLVGWILFYFYLDRVLSLSLFDSLPFQFQFQFHSIQLANTTNIYGICSMVRCFATDFCALIYHIIYTFRTQYFFIYHDQSVWIYTYIICAYTWNIKRDLCATRLDLQEIASDYL